MGIKEWEEKQRQEEVQKIRIMEMGEGEIIETLRNSDSGDITTKVLGIVALSKVGGSTALDFLLQSVQEDSFWKDEAFPEVIIHAIQTVHKRVTKGKS